MHPKTFMLLATLALVGFLAVAVAQAPNFSSLTTVVPVLTADSPHPLQVTVALPYREPQRRLLAPVPANGFDAKWPLSGPGTGMRTDHATEGR
ncbi:hypothetical protein [Kutzneria sp. NPDC052558]|uniref:hypothetical protein n=1 Tax=Kutzneria sp. NPDC052558 TaxID=3364121 RepID=UPI0037CBE632